MNVEFEIVNVYLIEREFIYLVLDRSVYGGEDG